MKLVMYLFDCVWAALQISFGYERNYKEARIGLAVMAIILGVFVILAVIFRNNSLIPPVLITIGLVIIFIVCAVAIEG